MLQNFIDYPKENVLKKKELNNDFLSDDTKFNQKRLLESFQKTKKSQYEVFIAKCLNSFKKKDNTNCYDPSIYWNNLEISDFTNASTITPEVCIPTRDYHEDDVYSNLLKIDNKDNNAGNTSQKCPRINVPFETLVNHWNSIFKDYESLSCKRNQLTEGSELTKNIAENVLQRKYSSPIAPSSGSTQLPSFRKTEAPTDEDFSPCNTYWKPRSQSMMRADFLKEIDMKEVNDFDNKLSESSTGDSNCSYSQDDILLTENEVELKKIKNNQFSFQDDYTTLFRNVSYQCYKKPNIPNLRRGVSESNLNKKTDANNYMDKNKLARSPNRFTFEKNKTHIPEFLTVELKKTGRLNFVTSEKSVHLEMISVLMRENFENQLSNFSPPDNTLLKPSVAKTLYEERLKFLREQRSNAQNKKD